MIWWVVGGAVGVGMLANMLDGAADQARQEQERAEARRAALARQEQARLEAQWARQERKRQIASIFTQELAAQGLVAAHEARRHALQADLAQLHENLRAIEASLTALRRRAALPSASRATLDALHTATPSHAQQRAAINGTCDQLRACDRALVDARRQLDALERSRRALTGSNPRRLS